MSTLELTKTLFAVPGGNIRKTINIVQEYTNTCVFTVKASERSLVRERLELDQLTFVYDWSNAFYCYVFKINVATSK